MPKTAKKPKLRKLSVKQAMFVQEYLKDFNGGQAAIRAGYSETGASVTGHRLLSYPNVLASLKKAQDERAIRVNITQDEVLSMLRVEAKGEGQDTNAAARIRANELLGKHLGMFTDKLQVENTGPPPVINLVPAVQVNNYQAEPEPEVIDHDDL